jgi:hypothetical protein
MVGPIGADLQKHIDACFTINEEITALFHPATSCKLKNFILLNEL